MSDSDLHEANKKKQIAYFVEFGLDESLFDGPAEDFKERVALVRVVKR
jgi:hypothetical protein